MLKTKKMVDMKNGEILNYSEIEDIDGEKCKILIDKIILSERLKKSRQDPNCCI
jgi:hypothetical protein